MSQPSIDHTNPPTEQFADGADLPHGDGEEEEEETDEEVEVESVPRKVQIVDTETVSDSIRPYTIYCVMVWRESGKVWLMCDINMMYWWAYKVILKRASINSSCCMFSENPLNHYICKLRFFSD